MVEQAEPPYRSDRVERGEFDDLRKRMDDLAERFDSGSVTKAQERAARKKEVVHFRLASIAFFLFTLLSGAGSGLAHDRVSGEGFSIAVMLCLILTAVVSFIVSLLCAIGSAETPK